MAVAEPHEINVELAALAGDVAALFQASLTAADGSTSAFAAASQGYAAWTVALGRPPAGTIPGQATPALVLQRLGALLPRMPEGALRQQLLALRRFFETQAAVAFMQASNSSESHGASGR